jgi:signal transduction histidine kinase
MGFGGLLWCFQMAKEPKFFWRGVMIVAPVLVLAGLGLYSLKQDRLLAEAQARERAQELAEDFADELMGVLQKEPSEKEALRFELDSTGKLVFPPPVAAIPAPAEPGEAAKRYRAGVLALQQGRDQEALEQFEAVARDYPDAIGETGLPLKPLAQLKWLELANNLSQLRAQAAALEESVGSNAVFQPTAITPLILQRLSKTKWQQEWERHEQIRRIYESARPQMRSPFPRLAWADEWLLARQQGEPIRYVCWHANIVEGKRGQGPYAFTASVLPAPPQQNWIAIAQASPLNRKMTEFADKLPRYFDYTLDLAGKPIVATNQLQVLIRAGGGKAGLSWAKSGAGSPPPAFGITSRAEQGTEYLRAAIHLISPQMLYERQRDRALWFGLLIAASASAAIFAGYSALRSFRRQQRLAQLKSDFVSSVSHELRAPIASVRLMAEGLERGSVTETQKQQEYFRFIVQECRRLGSMIENVLDFSRIEQGRKEYAFEPTDLPKLVEQTTKLMEPYAAERQVKLVTAVRTDVAEAQVDGRAIQQALVNLIDNAIKHSPQGAQVRVVLDGTDPIRLSVEDRGPGIPAEERQKIFERFYRCGSELRRETQGVGIGLSIVKHIVDAHGGTIHVASETGKGSTFSIVLPREQKEETNES